MALATVKWRPAELQLVMAGARDAILTSTETCQRHRVAASALSRPASDGLPGSWWTILKQHGLGLG